MTLDSVQHVKMDGSHVRAAMIQDGYLPDPDEMNQGGYGQLSPGQEFGAISRYIFSLRNQLKQDPYNQQLVGLLAIAESLIQSPDYRDHEPAEEG